MFADISRHLQIARPGNDDKYFAGVNVVLFGDFHQNKPVFERSLIESRGRTVASRSHMNRLGHHLYSAFTTAVELTQQMRVTDSHWQDILSRMRYGLCTNVDIQNIKKLVLKVTIHSHRVILQYADISLSLQQTHGPQLAGTEWETSATLLTARHSLRNDWNTLAVSSLSSQMGKRVFVSPALDYVGATPVNAYQAAGVAALNPKDRGGDMLDSLEIFVGMECMVTKNANTTVGIANGSRGVVVGIALHASDSHLLNLPQVGLLIALCLAQTYALLQSRILLSRPPAYVLFRPHRPNGLHLEGLEPNVIPIEPFKSMTFTINPGNNSSQATRIQTPILPAYSLTLMKCQGQNVKNSLIDPTTPPGRSGDPLSLNEFYVGCSRSSGTSTIRFLRRIPDRLEKLLQTHIAQYVRTDDARLRKQASDTRSLFEHGNLFTTVRGPDMYTQYRSLLDGEAVELSDPEDDEGDVPPVQRTKTTKKKQRAVA